MSFDEVMQEAIAIAKERNLTVVSIIETETNIWGVVCTQQKQEC